MLRPPEMLSRRYRPSDLDRFSDEELRRFLGDRAEDARAGRMPWEEVSRKLAWELLYRVEPELFDRLVSGEWIHPAVLEWLPDRIGRTVEVASGSGRFTTRLAPRCEELIAVEPAAPMRRLLEGKLEARGLRDRVEMREGFLDAIPVDDDWAELVCVCSAFTAYEAHGGESGLSELERVCAPGGLVVLVWPAHVSWLVERGFTHVSFPGEMWVDFGTVEQAVELAEIFYPDAAEEIARRGEAQVSYDVLGFNPPRDLVYKRLEG